jgi:hypothetical protein
MKAIQACQEREFKSKGDKKVYKKMILIVATFVLLTGAASNATFAQSEKADPIVAALFYYGVETSPGVLDPDSSIRYGNTFVLSSTGEWETRHLTVSLNYYASLPNGGNAFTIMSGTWSLVTYNNDAQYVGTLYGDVTGGVISFNPNSEGNIIGKRTYVELQSKGYLQPLFPPRRDLLPRKEIIKGTLEMITNFDSPQTSGTLNLDF